MTDTLFKQVNYNVGSLIEYIEMGDIGLPDIQRPFVWKNAKVRDLFDSMYRGYPVGYLLFWKNAFTDGLKQIGEEHKQKTPNLLVVDGQQRLTSLYAVIQGIPVLKKNYSKEQIQVAFNPLLEKFEVSDAAIRKDASYLDNISQVWNEGLFKVVGGYLERLSTSRDVSDEEKEQVETAITRLHELKSFPFTALELSANIDEEQVAEVFVRINSKGTPLNQADFILTLMSVFWDEGRKELEEFCRRARKPSTGDASPFNHYMKPDPDELLRVSVGLGFKRARLRNVYSILRGKDLETKQFSEERRDAQFEVLKAAQARTTNLTYWHDFFLAIRQAGYLGGREITSANNLIFAYILYLIGRTEYHVEERVLRRVIARYFFMSTLTGRYTGSPESDMEFDLARFRGVENPDEFVSILDGICDNTLTGDFWSITLPGELATSASWSPTLYAYYAALALLNATALFSKQKVSDLLEPSVHSTKKAAERHHLFPKAYLKSIGITETRDINQIANYALMEWHDNIMVSDQPPSGYVPALQEQIDPGELQQMYYWHALPDGWEQMAYDKFLLRRRELMAKVIADAFEGLHAPPGERPDTLSSVRALVSEGEGENVEFKSTLRVNLHTGERDKRIELGALKTIAGFLNGRGGTLRIGVADDGAAVGIEADGFGSEDKMSLHLVNLVRDRIGPQFMMYVHPRFADYKDKRILVVDCDSARAPVYLKDGDGERFFVRTGAATSEFTMSQAQDYVAQRWK